MRAGSVCWLMPRAAKNPRASPATQRQRVPPLPVPVHCSGEGCNAQTTFVLMGEGEGYEGGLFEDPGWTIGTGERNLDSRTRFSPKIA
jgi:hypothetical protein